MESQEDRRGKLIQMIQIVCCSSLLSVPGRAGAFSRDFTTSLAPECRAFSGALKLEKLKAPLIPGPEGAVDTNDRCISRTVSRGYEQPHESNKTNLKRVYTHSSDQHAESPITLILMKTWRHLSIFQ